MIRPVDVLAVMADCVSRPPLFTNDPYSTALSAEEYAAVSYLVEALKASDEWVRAAKEQGCKLPCENTLANNRAALAKFGGAA